MASTKYETRSILEALETFLQNLGWTGINYTDGYQSDTPIERPTVAVTFSPSRIREVQLGRDNEKLYVRDVHIDAYMENENQASDISDDIMEFLDLECITIKTHEDTILGTMQVTDTDSIRAQVFPPIMNMPRVLQWRGAVQGVYEAWYF